MADTENKMFKSLSINKALLLGLCLYGVKGNSSTTERTDGEINIDISYKESSSRMSLNRLFLLLERGGFNSHKTGVDDYIYSNFSKTISLLSRTSSLIEVSNGLIDTGKTLSYEDTAVSIERPNILNTSVWNVSKRADGSLIGGYVNLKKSIEQSVLIGNTDISVHLYEKTLSLNEYELTQYRIVSAVYQIYILKRISDNKYIGVKVQDNTYEILETPIHQNIINRMNGLEQYDENYWEVYLYGSTFNQNTALKYLYGVGDRVIVLEYYNSGARLISVLNMFTGEEELSYYMNKAKLENEQPLVYINPTFVEYFSGSEMTLTFNRDNIKSRVHYSDSGNSNKGVLTGETYVENIYTGYLNNRQLDGANILIHLNNRVYMLYKGFMLGVNKIDELDDNAEAYITDGNKMNILTTDTSFSEIKFNCINLKGKEPNEQIGTDIYINTASTYVNYIAEGRISGLTEDTTGTLIISTDQEEVNITTPWD